MSTTLPRSAVRKILIWRVVKEKVRREGRSRAQGLATIRPRFRHGLGIRAGHRQESVHLGDASGVALLPYQHETQVVMSHGVRGILRQAWRISSSASFSFLSVDFPAI